MHYFYAAFYQLTNACTFQHIPSLSLSVLMAISQVNLG